MKFACTFASIFSFYILNLNAQDIRLGFQTGCGFYNMSSLKTITQKSFSQLPFDAKIISNYPPYLYYQPMIKFAYKNFEFGLLYLFQSTGSRISSKDYSGEYRLDTRINSNSPGVIINWTIKDYKIIKLGFSLNSGVNFSELTINESLLVDTISSSSNYRLTAGSGYFEPGIYFIYPRNRISLELNIGYFKEIFKNDYTLMDGDHGKIPVKKEFTYFDMWDGLRLGVTFSYTILKKSDINN
jgi:hypothetical protein